MAPEPDEDLFKDVNQIYAIKPFPSSSKNNKLSKAPFEDLNPTLYAQKACYNGFWMTVDHLPVWIQAIYEKVYTPLAKLLAGPISHTSTQYIDFVDFLHFNGSVYQLFCSF